MKTNGRSIKWFLESHNYRRKKITEENPTMVIDIPEAKLSGFAGCNRMFGGISLDGTAFGIAFTQVATTRMACPDMKRSNYSYRHSVKLPDFT